MRVGKVRFHVIGIGLLPLFVQLSEHIDIVLPVVVKSSICSVSVAVLSSIIAVFGRIDG